MAKPLRKMLNNLDAPYMVELMRLIESQSKETLAKFCIDYAFSRFLPIIEDNIKGDTRAQDALFGAQDFILGKVKVQSVKALVLECNTLAKECEKNPAAQAAARAIGQAAGTVYTPTHSLGIALYGALAVAYSQKGACAKWEVLEEAAALECENIIQSLKKVAVENEPNKAKINWNC